MEKAVSSFIEYPPILTALLISFILEPLQAGQSITLMNLSISSLPVWNLSPCISFQVRAAPLQTGGYIHSASPPFQNRSLSLQRLIRASGFPVTFMEASIRLVYVDLIYLQMDSSIC